jgi:putative membrane protein
MALLDPNSPQTVKLIRIFSVIIPLAVAAIFGIKIEGVDLTFLPPIYAGMNAMTAVLLVLALIAIKSKNMKLHRRFVRVAMLFSIFFLLFYVAYHITSDPTSYGGNYSGIYHFILITHILFSVIVIPIVLFAYLFAWQGNFEKHKRWTRFAWPLWFYVAVTGVIVYWMISPFYAN